MKKLIATACLATAVALSAGPASADSIKGKLGITGKLGFLVPADNESDFYHNNTDTGFVVGGGLIYGLDQNFAGELAATRTWFGSETGDFGITDLGLGLQYRFTPSSKLVPYLGAGLDVLMSDYHPNFGPHQDVDTTVGAHLAGGLDYFVQRNLALTGEVKLLLAPDTDITDNFGNHTGNFDPSSVSGTVGLRYFF